MTTAPKQLDMFGGPAPASPPSNPKACDRCGKPRGKESHAVVIGGKLALVCASCSKAGPR